MKKIKTLLLVVIFAVASTGCASFGKKLKSWLGGKKAPATKTAKRKAMPKKRFSQMPSYSPGVRRKYSRMTKAKLKSKNELNSSSGSLWVMEGQGAYLFSQNIMRMVGDPIPVKIEGEPKQQLTSKTQVISDLLEKFKKRRQAALRKPASKKAGDKKAEKKAPAKTAAKPGGGDKKEALFDVKTVPTRIVERLVDGNYRVKGSQPFMIGKREYKVIVTGIVRSADFSEDGVSSTRLLDSKFDIVSKRRRE